MTESHSFMRDLLRDSSIKFKIGMVDICWPYLGVFCYRSNICNIQIYSVTRMALFMHSDKQSRGKGLMVIFAITSFSIPQDSNHIPFCLLIDSFVSGIHTENASRTRACLVKL